MDERTRYFRRLRRLRGSARRWTVLGGGFAGATIVLVPFQGIGALDAVWAGLAGASAVLAGWRWSDAKALAAQPAPDPPDPALAADRWLHTISQFPGGFQLAEHIRRQRIRGALRGSAAAGPAERLDRAARTMRELSRGLRADEVEAVREAARVERELRELISQAAAVEQALRSAPPDARPPLAELQSDLTARLEQGVAAYEQFVVAAAGYLSESAKTAGQIGPAALDGLTHATERLRAVAAGLAELRGLGTPGSPSAAA
ncbi:MAG TPA: hypothetical protein VIL37_12190 [Natronosporangium sp.]